MVRKQCRNFQLEPQKLWMEVSLNGMECTSRVLQAEVDEYLPTGMGSMSHSSECTLDNAR